MKHWVQIATIGMALTVGSIAAAQDDVAPQAVVMPPDPPHDAPREAPAPASPAVGGEGRWVFDLLGGQLGGPASTLGVGSLGGMGFVGPFTLSSFTNESDPQGLHETYKATVLALTPSADVFVTNRLSVGALLEAGILSTSTTQQQAPAMPGTAAPPSYTASERGYTVGIAPRVGYVVPLATSVALWPRLGGGYEISRRMDDNDTRTLTRTLFVEANLGVGIRVAKHAFFDLGPVLQYRRASTEAASTTPPLYYATLAPGSTESFGASLRAALRVDL